MLSRKLIVLLLLVAGTHCFSQVPRHIRYKQFLHGQPIHHTGRGQDSVTALYNGWGGKPVRFTYVGSMKDSLPEGMGSYFYEGNQLVYTGQWKAGLPHGVGTYFDLLPLYTRARFRGEFRDGVPVQGLVMYMEEESQLPKIFYSGPVRTDVSMLGALVPHGWGRMYATARSEHSFAAAGSYYEGQFYFGFPTGWGIYNKVPPTERIAMGSLKAGLLVSGLEVAALCDFKLSAAPLEAPTDLANLDTGVLDKVFPELRGTRYDTVFVDRTTTYYGMTLKGAPYGPGTVVYSDGFREPGFWKMGALMSTEELLAAVLPDPSVLKPVYRQEYHPVFVKQYDKKKKKEKWIVERQLRGVCYYSSWKGDVPAGWGWKVDTTYYGLPLGGFFSGISAGSERWEGDTVFAQLPAGLAGEFGIKTSGSPNDQYRQTPRDVFQAGYHPVRFLRSGYAEAVDEFKRLPYYSFVFHPTVALMEPRIARNSYQEFLRKDGERVRTLRAAIAARPAARISRIHFYPKDVPRTSLITSAGVIQGTMVSASEVKAGDAVLLSTGRFEQTGVYGQLPMNALLWNGKYCVVRDYRLEEAYSEFTCPVCKGSGGSTVSRNVDVQTGYSATPNYNLPGYANGAIVYTPKMSTIGSYQVKEKCTACKGNAYKKTNETKVELKY